MMPATAHPEAAERHGGSRGKILYVTGARPNFMKVASILLAARDLEAAEAAPAGLESLQHVLVHTGQHYDESMSQVFFGDLALPRPMHDLDVRSGTHAEQTARALVGLESVITRERPAMVVVVGDVNSTLAGALAAVKLHVPVAHVEAGLRSGDTAMPEEVNRILTDQICEPLYTTSAEAAANLMRESIPASRIAFVGNPMIDCLVRFGPAARATQMRRRLGLEGRQYAVCTLHRPSNVDDPATLTIQVHALVSLAKTVPVAFPVHARTRARLLEFGLLEPLQRASSVHLSPPLGYLEFLDLLSGASLALTDSGGIQEETTVLGVPCLTLRTTTERPITISEGTNRLVSPHQGEAIVAAARQSLEQPLSARRPELWDGRAGERILLHLLEWLQRRDHPC